MPRDASDAQIRGAYRRLAQRLHPDRRPTAGGDPSGGDQMVALNAAYDVLSHPERRADYDRRLAAGSRAGAARPSAAARRDQPRVADAPGAAGRAGAPPGEGVQVPWRALVAVAAVGSAAVLVSSLFVEPPAEEAPDGILRVGSCVGFEANGDVREIACTGVDDRVVELVIPLDASCPLDLEPRRDRLGLVRVCLVPGP